VKSRECNIIYLFVYQGTVSVTTIIVVELYVELVNTVQTCFHDHYFLGHSSASHELVSRLFVVKTMDYLR